MTRLRESGSRISLSFAFVDVWQRCGIRWLRRSSMFNAPTSQFSPPSRRSSTRQARTATTTTSDANRERRSRSKQASSESDEVPSGASTDEEAGLVAGGSQYRSPRDKRPRGGRRTRSQMMFSSSKEDKGDKSDASGSGGEGEGGHDHDKVCFAAMADVLKLLTVVHIPRRMTKETELFASFPSSAAG